MLQLCSVINFDEVQAVRALGALLLHLQDTVFNLEHTRIMSFASLARLNLDAFVKVDGMTLKGLQIFQEGGSRYSFSVLLYEALNECDTNAERHPNVIGGRGQSKEGFSLFGIFDRTRSVVGRNRLKEVLRKPIRDLPTILQRQDAVEFLMQPECVDLVAGFCRNLRRVYDLPAILLR